MTDRFHLHGTKRRKSPVALLLIDFINDLEFPQGSALLQPALPAARRTATLKLRAKAAGVPVIYVNDNFGRWQSDLRKQVRHCLQDGVRGEPLAQLLVPAEDDYFVLKPKSSAFFETTLHTLLTHLGTKQVILTGLAADVCILFTAHDAHLLDYEIVVPNDCVASESKRDTDIALRIMAKSAHARIRKSADVRFRKG